MGLGLGVREGVALPGQANFYELKRVDGMGARLGVGVGDGGRGGARSMSWGGGMDGQGGGRGGRVYPANESQRSRRCVEAGVGVGVWWWWWWWWC